MTLKEAMEKATREIMEENHFLHRFQSNEHDCFNWALKIFNYVPGTAIGGHRIDDEGQSYIIYEGRCYDAETHEGALYWWELRSFRRMIRGE